MNKVRSISSLTFVTIAAVVMGGDYIVSLLFPGLGVMLSLNKVLFLGIFIYDFLAYPSKYSLGSPIYIVCFLILLACIPFLGFVEANATGIRGAFDEVLGLLGTFAYMVFFYVNCRNTRTASRISVVLVLCSLFIVAYLLGIVLGLTGEVAVAWRGSVKFTRASGDFDPNIVMNYIIPLFAFGPLLALYSRAFSGSWKGIIALAIIILGVYVVLQLNSRSGTIVMGSTLIISLMFRLLLTPKWRLFSRIYAVCFVALLVSGILFLQSKYGIFDTIVSIYGETDLETDTSFAIRLQAYHYLENELLGPHIPHVFGDMDGYSKFWNITGVSCNPHCSLVDIYIKGGLIYLCIYIYLLVSSMVHCFMRTIRGENVRTKVIFAGFFAYLVGFSLMMMTLSIESTKMSWGIIGCALGLTAQAQIDALAMKRRAVTTEKKDVTQCPG